MEGSGGSVTLIATAAVAVPVTKGTDCLGNGELMAAVANRCNGSGSGDGATGAAVLAEAAAVW